MVTCKAGLMSGHFFKIKSSKIKAPTELIPDEMVLKRRKKQMAYNHKCALAFEPATALERSHYAFRVRAEDCCTTLSKLASVLTCFYVLPPIELD